MRIYETCDDGQREAGRILLVGGKLVPSDKKSQLLQTILEGAVPLPGESDMVTAEQIPEQLLEGLRYKYTGSYLRAGQVEDL